MRINQNPVIGTTPQLARAQSGIKTIASRDARVAGFTLVEVLIGMTLSLMIMGAVLSSYVFLGRNFTRSLGIASATDPNLEAQGRRSLAYFTQDMRMASGLTGTINANEVTLSLLTGAGSKNVTYYFNTTNTDVAVYGIIAPPNSLSRIDRATSTALTLHKNLLQTPSSPRFDYYDTSGYPYTSATLLSGIYLAGIKQIAVTLSSQAGISSNGTLTQIYETASPRLILRNKQLLQ